MNCLAEARARGYFLSTACLTSSPQRCLTSLLVRCNIVDSTIIIIQPDISIEHQRHKERDCHGVTVTMIVSSQKHTSGISQRESVRQNDFIGGGIEADGASLINERNEE